MISLEEINEIRQKQDWEELAKKSREHLKNQPDDVYVLRALVQALEKLEQSDVEYENALLRLVELKDRPIESAYKLYHHYKELGEKEAATRFLEAAIDAAADERQYEQLEEYWMQLVDLSPDDFSFFYTIAEKLYDMKQRQRAAIFLEMLLPATEERQDWKNRLALIKQILKYTATEEMLRDQVVDTFRKMYPNTSEIDVVIEHTRIQTDRALPEAVEEMELLTSFLPNSYVIHPDWGVGRVKDLNMRDKRVMINFQRKRNHTMDLELAKSVVERIASDDFRVMQIMEKEKLQALKTDDPVELVKVLLRSFNGSMNAREIKEQLLTNVITNREWSSWWSNTGVLIKKDPYISISGGALKQYTLRSEAVSDVEDLLKQFDDIKSPHSKVEKIYTYLRTTRKTDINESIIQHFSKKIQELTPRRKSMSERVELFYTNEDLKTYSQQVQSMPSDIVDQALKDEAKTLQIIQMLRFKTHQSRYAKRLKELKPDTWQNDFQRLLLEPDVEVRDELAKHLRDAGAEQRVHEVVDEILADFRNYPRPFIWLAEDTLAQKQSWVQEKVSRPVLIERLLLLVDNLTNQAKRRDRDEALWLRSAAGDAREIIRRNNYAIFKQSIQEADENIAQSIYRRAQTNEGLDGRTSSDLTTIVRARFPTLFQQVTELDAAVPEGLFCLPETLSWKKELLKRLVEKDLPEVVREIETARAHGDLRENAEYHAARDKQKLLSSQVAELQEQLHSAQSVQLESVGTDMIGFGTQFVVSPLGASKVEDYIMLGPWESDPDNSVLSYQAPFARAFMGKGVGEKVEIELPMHTGRYEVLEIHPIAAEKIQEILDRIIVKPPEPAGVAQEE